MPRCDNSRFVVALATMTLLQITNSAENNELHQLTTDFLAWKMREWPEFATRLGVHDYDDQVESYAFNHLDERKLQCEVFLRRARAVSTDSLSLADQLSRSILIDQLDTFIEGYRWREYGHLTPINFLEGFHKETSWIYAMKFETVQDFHTYRQRLHKIPRQLDDIMVLMKMAVANGHTNHMASMDGVMEQLNMITNSIPERSTFYYPYEEKLHEANFTIHDRETIRAEGRSVIRGSIIPAYRRIQNFLTSEYLPNTRPEPGVGSLPNGTQYYEDALRWHLSESRTPAEVHELGNNEVNRITREMRRVMGWLGHSGSISSFITKLMNDSQYFADSEELLLERYRKTIYQDIAPRLPALFHKLDSIPPLTVRAMREDLLAAFYVKNQMVVNTFNVETRPTFEITAISLHEALPGHHLQLSVFYSLDIPEYRKKFNSRKRYSVPMHFPYYTAYIEGWGLYAENLGEELGLFDDPLDIIGKHCFELFRSVRLVVDTGIHAFRWSREEAVRYMKANTCLTDDIIEAEVNRYITWPGQACSYKIGQLKINDLRITARRLLGDHFDIRDFHREVLGLGPVPLRLLEEHILKWIQNKQLSHVNIAPKISNGACRVLSASTKTHILLYFVFTMGVLVL